MNGIRLTKENGPNHEMHEAMAQWAEQGGFEPIGPRLLGAESQQYLRGHVDKKNRPDQASFVCRACGVKRNADRAPRQYSPQEDKHFVEQSTFPTQPKHHTQWWLRAASPVFQGRVGLSHLRCFGRFHLVVLRGRESVGEGDSECVESWLPAHCPSHSALTCRVERSCHQIQALYCCPSVGKWPRAFTALRANHFPDLHVIVQEGDELFPRVLPQPHDRGIR